MAGGNLVARFGLEKESDLGKLGKGDTVLVVASDIQEETPIWFLRLKQAASRGAKLIVLNPRKTKLDQYAHFVLRYRYGEEIQAISSFLPGSSIADETWGKAVEAFAKAENAIVFYGSEGIGLETSQRLSQVCAELLFKTKHVGRPNNGLIAAWHVGNVQGAWDMGFSPDLELVNSIKKAGVAYLVGVDPAGDHPNYERALETADFVVVQDLFLSESAKLAHVVFPAQTYTEREGTFTSGERRLQRFYSAVVPLAGPLPDFSIAARIAKQLGVTLEEDVTSLVFEEIEKTTLGYEGMSYQTVSEVKDQWPIVGRGDLYYGGTSYENKQGLGAVLKTIGLVKSAELPEEAAITQFEIPEGMIRVVPTASLYDQNQLVRFSKMLQNRLAQPVVSMHPKLVEQLGLEGGGAAQLQINGVEVDVTIKLDEQLPEDTATVPRDVGIPISKPVAALLRRLVLESKIG
jgi:NADH-quinone oxidoreductase subunit G